MNTEERLQQLEDKMDRILAYYEQENFPSKVIIKRQFVLMDQNRSIVFDSQGSGGFSLGSASGKVAFYGATPVSKASAIGAPSTPSGTYNQSEAQSAVTAINSIRTALTNLGLTS